MSSTHRLALDRSDPFIAAGAIRSPMCAGTSSRFMGNQCHTPEQADNRKSLAPGVQERRLPRRASQKVHCLSLSTLEDVLGIRVMGNSAIRALPGGVALIFLLFQGMSSAQVGDPRASADRKTAYILESDPQSHMELWQTALGRLWIPAPGKYVIPHLEWENVVEQVYRHPLVHVRPGDVVLDCGAHIGGFTRLAVQAGARIVVSVEPEPANLAALRRNLGSELESGRVRLVARGVWDTVGKLTLHRSYDGDSHSVIVTPKGPGDVVIDVTTLDSLSDELRLPRVDFIKMDIEGSERNALRGAAKLINRWKPRLAISSYHLQGDPAIICESVWGFRSDYKVATKDLIKAPHGKIVPKVLFFY